MEKSRRRSFAKNKKEGDVTGGTSNSRAIRTLLEKVPKQSKSVIKPGIVDDDCSKGKGDGNNKNICFFVCFCQRNKGERWTKKKRVARVRTNERRNET